MSERTFVPDGDPSRAGLRRADDLDVVDPVVDDADAQAGVARRLQGRLDRLLRLLGRMQGDPLLPEPAQLPELQEIARRMRRDSESLLLLAGRDAGARLDEPQRLGALLDAAAAAAEEPHRVDIVSGPSAAVVPGAATELLHVLAELIDHTTAVYPGARVAVAAAFDGPGAVAVAVRADGALRYDPDGLGAQRALDAAERLAGRSRHGLVLRRELDGEGAVATVVCPRTAVIVEEPQPAPAERNGHASGANGYAGLSGALPIEDLPAHPLAATTLSGPPSGLDVVPTPETGFQPVEDDEPLRTVERDPAEPADDVHTDAVPPRKIDELFGPITDIPFDPSDAMTSTPIFEAIASAWFLEDSDGADREPAEGAGPLDWETPNDREWRAASERATRSEAAPLTAQGLPMRRPGNQLVPPPRSRTDDEPERPAARVPDLIRDRLSGFQRGLQQGRHRADAGTSDPGDPEFW